MAAAKPERKSPTSQTRSGSAATAQKEPDPEPKATAQKEPDPEPRGTATGRKGPDPEARGPGEEAKRKFREALERKRSQQGDHGAGLAGPDSSKIHGAHGPAVSRRTFRRRSGS
jgi:hypothetical protein